MSTELLHRSRREFLQSLGCGFGTMALGGLLAKEALGGGMAPHHPAKAKAVIQIFCPGGISQVDTWDHKPELTKRTGTPFDPEGKLQFFASKPGNCQGSHWKFRRHGACGRPISDLFPRLATCVDDMAFIHSMHSKSALHGPAMFMMNSGFILPGFPTMGAWVTYGLGSAAENLPAYVVLPDPRGLPPGGVLNWGPGFLPAKQQGTPMEAGEGKPPLADLFLPKDFKDKNGDAHLLGLLNKRHAKERPGNSELEARIKAYEMAAKLQLSAPEATDIRSETLATRKLFNWRIRTSAPSAANASWPGDWSNVGCASCRFSVEPKIPPPGRFAPTGTVTRIFRATTATGDASWMAAQRRYSRT